MDYKKQYVNFLRRFIKLDRPLKVVFDCSNGTTGIILNRIMNNESRIKGGRKKPIIHNSLGGQAKFIILNSKPDGNFPAHGPNPMAKGAMNQLRREVKKQKANLGVIFDADGDRVFFVDNLGRAIDPNEAGYILMQRYKSPYIVGATSSWRLKKLTTNNQQLTTFVSRVGHYYFKKLMKEKKANLGLEHSGHYYFPFKFGRETAYFDSGILAAIEVMNFVSGLDGGLAEWLVELPKYYRSGEINFEVGDKEGVLKRIEKFYRERGSKITKIDGLTVEFGPSPLKARHLSGRLVSRAFKGEGWFNLRPSNTENFLRLNLEAVNQKILKEELQNIKKLL